MINNVLMCPPRRMQMRKCADVYEITILVDDYETACYIDLLSGSMHEQISTSTIHSLNPNQ